MAHDRIRIGGPAGCHDDQDALQARHHHSRGGVDAASAPRAAFRWRTGGLPTPPHEVPPPTVSDCRVPLLRCGSGGTRSRRGSGGDGFAPGGDGLIKKVEVLADCTLSPITERRSSRPWACGAASQASPARTGSCAAARPWGLWDRYGAGEGALIRDACRPQGRSQSGSVAEQ